MSVDYYVAVHQANWPTAAAVQACLVERDYPVRLEAAPAEPLTGNGMLAVRFDGRPVELEASTVRLSPTSAYAYRLDRPADLKVENASGVFEVQKLRPDDMFTPADINEDLAHIGARSVRFGNGDYVLTLSFHVSADAYRAGFYLMGAMIDCFDGYGFEFQGPSHGARAYAADLIADAADDAYWDRRERELEAHSAALAADKDSPENRAFDEMFAFIQESLRKFATP